MFSLRMRILPDWASKFSEARVLLSCQVGFIVRPAFPGDTVADVCTTADAGPHSLRDAINYVNSQPPPPPGYGYLVAFDIQALGVQTIHLRSPLPQLNNGILIDGTTQCYSLSTSCTPYSGTPVIELDGSGAGPNANGLVTNAQSLIAGLAINRFSSSGIVLQRHEQSFVLQNYIGTDPLGTTTRSNRAGVTVGLLGDFATIENNLISGNTDAGVIIQGNVTGTLLQGNMIGTDYRGLNSLANGNGVVLASGTFSNTIGGSSAAAANLISGNRTDGILIRDADTSDNIITGNKIGTNITGTADLGLFNNVNGIEIIGEPNPSFPTHTLINNNQISGNLSAGIRLSRFTQNNVIANNSIGTNAAGTSALGNGQSGIMLLDVSNNTVGGATASARNIISGNGENGILIGAGGTLNSILGNYIGLNRAGTAPVGNGIGIQVQAGTNNTIGGTPTASRNVISGNRISGITLSSDQSTNNQILGNFIGLNAAGGAAVGNNIGIMLSDGAANNTIGGTDPGAGNVISGNLTSGILIADGATGTQVQGNFIGTNPAGTGGIRNRTSGIAIVRSSGNIIGGLVANLIGFNGTDGVLVDTGINNTISQNSIFSNSGLGIHLINGGNQLLPFPAIDSAVSVTSDPSITITGSFSGDPDANYAVEFFTNSVCNPSGNGEGEQFIGLTGFTTDDSGNADISAAFNVAVDPGQFVTATTTDGQGNTSEFSTCTQVTDGGPSGAPGSHGNGGMIGRDLVPSLGRTPLSMVENQAEIANFQNPSLSEQSVDLLFTRPQVNERRDSATRDRVFANLSLSGIQNGNSILEMGPGQFQSPFILDSLTESLA